ncbi:MAG: endonuclease/exonuclease/phosphatase family protein, partial [Planctomycetota bacterium]
YERYDSRIRDAELMKLARLVADDADRPWLIAGDFNDVAWSRTTRRFEKNSGLLDPRVGRKLLNTYHARLPILRYPLDHVYVAPGFESGGLKRIRIPGSDHFGVLAELRLADADDALHPPESPRDAESESIIEQGENDAEARHEATASS